VKPHTRYGKDYDDLPEEITLLPEIDTSSLIDSSEIILFWSSSVALEGFQKGRTMINLDFLNGNRSIYADLGAGFQCRSRDDVLAVLCSQEVMREAVKISATSAATVLANAYASLRSSTMPPNLGNRRE
jgi:hypothetical protein